MPTTPPQFTPDDNSVTQATMSRQEAASFLREWGWRPETIKVLLWPRPPRGSFTAGEGVARRRILVEDDGVRPVR